MPDLKTIEGKVLIDADRYEELIKLESRVEIIVNYLKIDQYISAFSAPFAQSALLACGVVHGDVCEHFANGAGCLA